MSDRGDDNLHPTSLEASQTVALIGTLRSLGLACPMNSMRCPNGVQRSYQNRVVSPFFILHCRKMVGSGFKEMMDSQEAESEFFASVSQKLALRR